MSLFVVYLLTKISRAMLVSMAKLGKSDPEDVRGEGLDQDDPVAWEHPIAISFCIFLVVLGLDIGDSPSSFDLSSVSGTTPRSPFCLASIQQSSGGIGLPWGQVAGMIQHGADLDVHPFVEQMLELTRLVIAGLSMDVENVHHEPFRQPVAADGFTPLLFSLLAEIDPPLLHLDESERGQLLIAGSSAATLIFSGSA